MRIKQIRLIEDLIQDVRKQTSGHKPKSFLWFRGEPKESEKIKPLIPSLYRKKENHKYENILLQHFRWKAPAYGLSGIPNTNETDKWLFLARHVGLPTRLLDWTENLMVALYWALHSQEPGAVVWMINPEKLNELARRDGIFFRIKEQPSKKDFYEFPLSWFSPETDTVKLLDLVELKFDEERKYKLYEEDDSLFRRLEGAEFPRFLIKPGILLNIGNINFRGAWENDGFGTRSPVAIHPANIHPRMVTQKSCFTIHGLDKRSLVEMVPDLLIKYEIDDDWIDFMKRDLWLLGSTHSAIDPDLDGLAKELTEAFCE